MMPLFVAFLGLLPGCRTPPAAQTKEQPPANPGGALPDVDPDTPGVDDDTAPPESGRGLPDTSNPYAFCEQLGFGLPRLNMKSVHGRAYFWEPRPSVKDDQAGFMMAIQAATGEASVCDEPHTWDWYDDPVPGEYYIVFTWLQPPGRRPTEFPGIYEWDDSAQVYPGQAAEGFRLHLGRYDEDWADYAGKLMWWWAPDDLYGDTAWLCVTDATPEHIKLRLVVRIGPDNSHDLRWWGPGFLIDIDAQVDPKPDDDPCFIMKSTIDEGELWGEKG